MQHACLLLFGSAPAHNPKDVSPLTFSQTLDSFLLLCPRGLSRKLLCHRIFAMSLHDFAMALLKHLAMDHTKTSLALWRSLTIVDSKDCSILGLTVVPHRDTLLATKTTTQQLQA
jgi:hypothetical protein